MDGNCTALIVLRAKFAEFVDQVGTQALFDWRQRPLLAVYVLFMAYATPNV